MIPNKIINENKKWVQNLSIENEYNLNTNQTGSKLSLIFYFCPFLILASRLI